MFKKCTFLILIILSIEHEKLTAVLIKRNKIITLNLVNSEGFKYNLIKINRLPAQLQTVSSSSNYQNTLSF